MTIVKIIIFLLTLLFLYLSTKAKSDSKFVRHIIIGSSCLIVFVIIELCFFTAFTVAGLLFISAGVTTICNIREPKKIIKFAVPFLVLAIISFIIAL